MELKPWSNSDCLRKCVKREKKMSELCRNSTFTGEMEEKELAEEANEEHWPKGEATKGVIQNTNGDDN